MNLSRKNEKAKMFPCNKIGLNTSMHGRQFSFKITRDRKFFVKSDFESILAKMIKKMKANEKLTLYLRPFDGSLCRTFSQSFKYKYRLWHCDSFMVTICLFWYCTNLTLKTDFVNLNIVNL